MTDEELHVLSKDRIALQRAINRLNDVLKTKGMRPGPGYINSQSVGAFKAVVGRGEDPHDKTDNWMLPVFPSTLELVNEQPGGTIYHAYVDYQTMPGTDARGLIEKADLPDEVVVQYQSRQKAQVYHQQSRGAEPFSYDPARDYYTEPDRAGGDR